jgi:hypothetical protein
MAQNYAMRTFWTEEQEAILKENVHLSAKELVLLCGKSEAAIDQKRRALVGTNAGKTRLKKGWDIPSKKLAYLLGSFAADGYVGPYSVQLAQKEENKEMFARVVEFARELFGRRVAVKKRISSYVWKGEKRVKEYDAMYFCSKEFFDKFKRKKVKENGDWMSFVETFPWLADDEYFWSFVGGLYDGDGSLARKNYAGGTWYEVTIAVKQELPKQWLVDRLKCRGFEGAVSDSRVTLSGGQKKVDEFLGLVDCVIERKKRKEVVVENERVVRQISHGLAKEFVSSHHYLGGMQIGTVDFGLFRGDVLVGVASYGVASAGLTVLGNDTYRIRELVRLVLSDEADNTTDKSLLIGRSLKEFKRMNPEVYLVFTYADISANHTGRVYLSANGVYLGKTGEQVGWRRGTIVLSGRHVRPTEGDVAVVLPGKQRYCFVCAKGGLRKQLLKQLQEKYGRTE